jgi:hypothetical protein
MNFTKPPLYEVIFCLISFAPLVTDLSAQQKSISIKGIIQDSTKGLGGNISFSVTSKMRVSSNLGLR